MSEAFLSRGGNGNGSMKVARINQKVTSYDNRSMSIQFDFEPSSVILTFFMSNSNGYEYKGSIVVHNEEDLAGQDNYIQFGEDTILAFSDISLHGRTLTLSQSTSYIEVYVIGVAL